MSDTDPDRHIYLEKKRLEDARRIIREEFQALCPLSAETVPVSGAVGRVLAEGVAARTSSPPCHLAAMDGIAVKAEVTFGAGETTPRRLVLEEQTFFVNTGNPLPPTTDAVIMIEDVHMCDARTVEIIAPAFPWQHVRRAGEDIVATELLFPANHVIRPYCVGALLTAGVMSVSVRKKPRLLIVPTGDELVDSQQVAAEGPLPPAAVVESNSHMLGGLVEQYGGSWERHAILPDDPEQITAVVRDAVDSGDYQMVLLVGGSSAGARDYSRTVIRKSGRLLLHGVTIMPGKPLIAGKVASLPVFGMPGYPVSAVVCFEQLVRPLLLAMQGRPDFNPPRVTAVLTRKVASRLGVEEFLRVKLGYVDDTMVATQMPRGAGAVTSLAEADAFVRIPENVEGLAEGTAVPAELIRPLDAVENTVVAVGSHDNTLDVLADQLSRYDPRLKLVSSHVGSLGGLQALAKGYSHLGGSHLLDPETGEYNLSHVRKYLPGVPVRLVRLVARSQGLMVAPGNPKKISSLAELTRAGVTFINRQAGSGTRVLLDYRLAELGLDAAGICGYDQEAYTHMSVAVAVASGSADAGLGILAAARALGLDFVPVVTEEYDLVIPERFLALPGIQALLAVIRTPEFQESVRRLGGYDTATTGSIVRVG